MFYIATLTNHLIGGNGEAIEEVIVTSGDTEAEARAELAERWGATPHECPRLTVEIEVVA